MPTCRHNYTTPGRLVGIHPNRRALGCGGQYIPTRCVRLRYTPVHGIADQSNHSGRQQCIHANNQKSEHTCSETRIPKQHTHVQTNIPTYIHEHLPPSSERLADIQQVGQQHMHALMFTARQRRPSGRSADRPTDQPTDTPAGIHTGRPANKPTDIPAYRHTERPTEMTNAMPKEHQTHRQTGMHT